MDRVKGYLTLMGFLILLGNIHAQEIRGKVVDADTKEPLAFANVSLLNTTYGATTDIDGNYLIQGAKVGRYDVATTYMGYEPQTQYQVLVSSGKQTEVNFHLKPSAIQLEDVVIKYKDKRNETINTMSGISGVLLSVDESKRLAGSVGDPARLAMNFAGVASGNLQDNAIVVRGNSPKGILWRVEGVEVFNPNHMAGGNIAGGGFLNIFSTNLLANSDFYTGAFPAEYGNALSGVFDINLRNGNTQQREHFLQLGVLGLEMGSEGYFRKGSQASYNIGLRLSSMGIIGRLSGGVAPSYQDLSFKTNFPTQHFGTFSIWGMGGISSNHKPIKEYQEKWKDGVLEKFKYPQFENDWTDKDIHWRVGAAGIGHRILLGENVSLKTDLVATGNSYSYKKQWYNEAIDKYFDQTNNSIDEWKTTLQTALSYRKHLKVNTRFGITEDLLFVNYAVNKSPEHEAPIVNKVHSDGKTHFTQAFAQLAYSPWQNLSINGGLHSSYFGLTQEVTIEPRASVKWNITPTHAIGLAYGKHTQREELKLYYTPDPMGNFLNQKLKMEESEHFVFTYEWMMNEHLRLRVEPYVQYLRNIPVIEGTSFSVANYKKEWLINQQLSSDGTARNIGVDITLEKFFNKGWYFMLTGSLFDAKYTGGDGIERNSAFNRNYVANLLIGKEFIFEGKKKSRVLGTNLKVNALGGYYLHPLLEESSLAAKKAIYDESKAYSVQQEPSLFVDVAFYLKTNYRKFTGTWLLEVKNATWQTNSRGYQYNIAHARMEKDDYFFFLPQLAYRIEF